MRALLLPVSDRNKSASLKSMLETILMVDDDGRGYGGKTSSRRHRQRFLNTSTDLWLNLWSEAHTQRAKQRQGVATRLHHAL